MGLLGAWQTWSRAKEYPVSWREVCYRPCLQLTDAVHRQGQTQTRVHARLYKQDVRLTIPNSIFGVGFSCAE